MWYPIWGACRQTAARLGILAETAVYRCSGGRAPKALFTLRAHPHYVGTHVKVISFTNEAVTIAKCDPSGKPTDAPFVILSSTDFHYDTDHEKNLRTTDAFLRQIETVKPDLVVLTGDVILSKYQQVDAIKFADMMETLGVYWTAVFGNHETREPRGFYKWLLLKSFADRPHCLCRFGSDALFGYGNYAIHILGAGSRLRKSLFFLDSGRDILPELCADYGLPAGKPGYDFLKREQIAWVQETVESMRRQYGECRALLYFHIPVPEFEAVFETDGCGGYRPSEQAELLYGAQHESVGCSPFNSGLFDALQAQGSLQAIFCGHDHINDWCARYKGVYLVYNLPGNYNSYHLGTKCGFPESRWVQGVTVTTLLPDGELRIEPRYHRDLTKTEA